MTTYPHAVTRRDLVTLALIVVIAAVMRLHDGGATAHYAYDQGDLALTTLDMIAERTPTLVGIQSSAGVPNSPVTVYTLAPLYVLTDNPQHVTGLIALFNVAGVGLLWLLAHRYIDPRVAALAGLIYALNPYAIYYSRSVWAQAYHTPIILAGIGLGLAGFWEGRRWAQIACLPVLLWGVQIHYAAWTLMPLYGWLVIAGWRQVAWRWVLASVALAALTLVPFALGAAESEGSFSEQTQTMRDVIRYDWRVRGDALTHHASLATGLNMAEQITKSARGAAALDRDRPTPDALWTIMGLLTLAGLAGIWRCAPRRAAALVLLWALIPVAVFATNWTGTGLYPHYFVPSLPAYALLTAAGAAGLLGLLPSRWIAARIALTGAVGLLALTWGSWLLGVMDHVDSSYTPGGYRTPVHYLLDVAAELRDTGDILIVGGDSNTSGVQVWHSILYRTADHVREVVTNTGQVAVFPEGPFAAISPPTAPDSPLTAIYASDDSRQVPLRPGEGSYTLNFFPDGLEWPGPGLEPVEPVRFANGVTLTGYSLAGDQLTLAWKLPEADPEAGYLRAFGHVLTADDDRLGGTDLDFWPGQYWAAGDRAVNWIDLPLGEPGDILRVGLYFLPDDGGLVYVDVVNEQGQIIAPWVDIPLGG